MSRVLAIGMLMTLAAGEAKDAGHIMHGGQE
jgi:hypothetical protein